MIEIENLRAAYNGKNILNVEKLSLEDGKITAIVGLNGSGKSTLLKSLLGMKRGERGNSGRVLIDGKNLSSLSHKERARLVGYLPQINQNANLDVYTLVCHGRFPYLGYSKILGENDRLLVENALRLTDMWKKKDKNLGEISGGERQRAYLAMVIAQDTKMILLDEPATYMDIKHQIEVLDVLSRLAQSGKGIVLTSHDLPQSFSICDKVCLMQEGKIVAQGSGEEVLSDGESVRSVMGVSLKKISDSDSIYQYNLVR